MVMTVTEERLLTVAQVAQHMSVTEETVRRWLRDGKLRGLRPGGNRMGWRIRAGELERFIGDEERAASNDA